MSEPPVKITALTPKQAASAMATAYKRRIDEDQVRQIADEAGLLRADGTLNLIEYVAYLAQEATRGQD